MSEWTKDHPGREVLVDLIEGVAVDVTWKEHLTRCESCSAEVQELKGTLEALKQVGIPTKDEGYWCDFESRLHGRIEKDRKRRAKNARWLWVVGAAATVVLSLWVTHEIDLGRVATTPESADRILPPAEEDSEYQLLLSFSKVGPNREVWAESLNRYLPSVIDPTQLTREEREHIVREIQRKLGDMDHEKS